MRKFKLGFDQSGLGVHQSLLGTDRRFDEQATIPRANLACEASQLRGSMQ
jgi:hypothetical protein